MSHFSLHGQYRVQSRRDYATSALEGEWYGGPGLLGNAGINEALRAHPFWTGQAQVALRPALISQRFGKFASEPDILYKHELFIPAPDSDAMLENIVDVLKSWQNWIQRKKFVQTLFCAEDYQHAMGHLSDLQTTIANEYMVHEAGHFIAYDVSTKQNDGYFAPGGKTVWPLIYLEEFRADLNAFGFAVKLLPPEQAVQIFLYNLLLRFGVHRQGILTLHSAPYGLIPYLLFCLLNELGFVAVINVHGRYCFRLSNLHTTTLIGLMQDCAHHAKVQLNTVEMATTRSWERALAAASYVRNRLEQYEQTRQFALVMNQPATDKEQA